MSANKTIFLDLDETLIDTSERHYKVYCDIVKILGLDDSISKDEFWKLKRNGMSTIKILNESDTKVLGKFSNLWIEKIEKKSYLSYDKVFRDTEYFLSKLKEEKLILSTMRNNRENLIWEIKKLGLFGYFDSVLSCSPFHHKDKTKPIISYNFDNSISNNNSIIVGDSEIDIITGKKLKMTTIAVNYGIRSKKFLNSLNPDYCLKNIIEINDIIKRL